jgi:hypothetical protein
MHFWEGQNPVSAQQQGCLGVCHVMVSDADQLLYWLQCRSRQSAITTELIEIISGAAALEG